MTQKYIKTPIPPEISDKGGATIQFVEKQTVPLKASVREAIDGLYVLGQEPLVTSNVAGLLRSAADGIRRDGHARQIADHITIYPVVTGEIDMDYGWNPAVNGVRIIARLLNELELDITNWSFEDVTPGRQPFRLNTVSTLGAEGVAEVGKALAINGSGLPKTDAIRVDWAVEGTDRSGTIPAAKVTSDDVRADIAADALAELASEAYDGKTIVFTVRGNFSSAKISAKLKVIQPDPLVTSSDGFVKVMSIDEDPVPALDSFTVRGVNVGYKSGDAEQGLPDHGLMGALATVDGQPLTWHCTAFDDEHASEATFESDGCEEELTPGEYTAALTLNYAVDDGTGVSHLEPLVIENVRFTVGE